MYWKLLILLFRHRSVSLDFLKTAHGFNVLDMRSNGAWAKVDMKLMNVEMELYNLSGQA